MRAQYPLLMASSDLIHASPSPRPTGLSLCLGSLNTALGATVLMPGVSWRQGFALETAMTFLLMNTALHTADDFRAAGLMAPWARGSTLTFCILLGYPLTGASLSPARTLGPNLFAGLLFATPGTLVYFTAPFVGAWLAAALWKCLALMQVPRVKRDPQ